MAAREQASAPYRAHLAHRARRRLRLRLDGPRLTAKAAQDLADSLSSVDGVARVVLRPNTRSLIIETRAEAGEVLEDLKASRTIEITPTPRPVPVGQALRMGLAQADIDLDRRTDGALDLRTTIALLLAAGAVIQLARGRVAGPATTMAMSAFALLDRATKDGRR